MLPKFSLGVCKINYLLQITPMQCTKLGPFLFEELLENGLRTIVGGGGGGVLDLGCLPAGA